MAKKRQQYKRFRRKPKCKTIKDVAWDWMSRWVRIKAAISLAERWGSDPAERVGECYTCGVIKDVAYMDGGHFKSREMGGASGLYFDERAIRVQCKQKCNAFGQGKPTEFRANLVKEYNEETVLELERLHRLPSRWGSREYPGLILHYKAEVKKLLEETGIRKWW